MEKKIFVKDLRDKEEVATSFMVKHFSLMEARDGKKYVNANLSDATGNVECRIWVQAEEYAQNMACGDFVYVRGKLNLYQGRRQFIVSSLKKLDAKEIQKDDYIYKAPLGPEEMHQRLLAIVEKADDYYIKNLLLGILNDEEIARRLKRWPAGKSIHHAYQSGLLEHILSCAQLAQVMSAHYQCNFNYVLAGCIVHDLCKIYELTDGINPEYTDEGKLLGHLAKGPELIDRFAPKEIPDLTRIHLKHILLSHHGEYAFGSPKLPQTSEAMLVHLIDLMDSRMNALETIKRTDCYRDDWSGHVRHLDRAIYRPPLPHFTRPQEKSKQRPKDSDIPLKQNLGKLLKDFKVERKIGLN